MSAYDNVRIKKLVLKGEKHKYVKWNCYEYSKCAAPGNIIHFRKSKKRKKEKDEAGTSSKKSKVLVDEDAVEHGGWWAAKSAADITGTVSIEFNDRCYLKALDNG